MQFWGYGKQKARPRWRTAATLPFCNSEPGSGPSKKKTQTHPQYKGYVTGAPPSSAQAATAALISSFWRHRFQRFCRTIRSHCCLRCSPARSFLCPSRFRRSVPCGIQCTWRYLSASPQPRRSWLSGNHKGKAELRIHL